MGVNVCESVYANNQKPENKLKLTEIGLVFKKAQNKVAEIPGQRPCLQVKGPQQGNLSLQSSTIKHVNIKQNEGQVWMTKRMHTHDIET